MNRSTNLSACRAGTSFTKAAAPLCCGQMLPVVISIGNSSSSRAARALRPEPPIIGNVQQTEARVPTLRRRKLFPPCKRSSILPVSLAAPARPGASRPTSAGNRCTTAGSGRRPQAGDLRPRCRREWHQHRGPRHGSACHGEEKPNLSASTGKPCTWKGRNATIGSIFGSAAATRTRRWMPKSIRARSRLRCQSAVATSAAASRLKVA